MMIEKHYKLESESEASANGTCAQAMSFDAVLLQHAIPISLLLVVTLAFTALFSLLQGRNRSRPLCHEGKGPLLPSPPAFPLVGNLHQLGPLAHRSLCALARRHGPLMLLHFGRTPTLVVSSAEAAGEILRTHDLAFASRPPSTAARRYMYGYRDMALAPYGEYWRQVRRIGVLHLLSSKQVQSFRAVREEEVASLVDDISTFSEYRSVNLSEKLVGLTNGITCRVAFGKKYSGKDDAGVAFRELLREFLEVLGAFKVGDFIPSLAWVDKVSGFDARLEKNFQQLDGFLEKVIEEHANARRAGSHGKDANNNFVDVLLSLHTESDSVGLSLDRDSIKSLILDVFAAGTDTIFTTIEWAMTELIRHPEVMKKVQDEVRGVVGEKALVREDDLEHLSYLKSVVKEALRLHPPIPLLLPRESLSSVRVHGYQIPVNTRVIINAWAIGRDPVTWERAEEFWPERFTHSPVDFKGQHFQLIPFGAGRRGCPGISFAMAIVELALANLFYHFDWRVPDGSRREALDVSETCGLTAHRKSNLVLVPVPRCPVRDE